MVKVTQKIADDSVYFSSIYGVHTVDALHAMMAKLNNCYLVTRGRDLTYAAKKYEINTFKPEELI
jgi:predicted nucleic acid-binding protein